MRTRTFRVDAPALAAGTYVVAWRARSGDGHIMADTFRFTIAAATP